MTFHVPERYRVRAGPLRSDSSSGNNGFFMVPLPSHRRDLRSRRLLVIIASNGEGWEHVSVHVETHEGEQTPAWNEMCMVKELFWDNEDVVMQLHPRRSEYINLHPHTLHLWRPIGADIPTPPKILVGF